MRRKSKEGRVKGYFVTGIGTDVGKTVISAILVQALGADYWKPIQAGSLGFTDSNIVRSLISNAESVIHPEAYRLNAPMSPHAAARLDGIHIELDTLRLPAVTRPLIVEGAGGLMVPLDTGFLVRDLISSLGLPVILVSRNYLGSINHTLLSVEALKAKGIEIAGIIFNGERNEDSESFILEHTGVRLLGAVGIEEIIDQSTVLRYAAHFKEVLR
ncbi:MAG: dethiobiotin synthase [Deltaproteobacteria bacterium]|nr:dethiobiotin synthase [Deltaproteobacteria bacterium]